MGAGGRRIVGIGEQAIASTKAEMRTILDEIRSGKFAEEWIAESEAGRPRFLELEKAAAGAPATPAATTGGK